MLRALSYLHVTFLLQRFLADQCPLFLIFSHTSKKNHWLRPPLCATSDCCSQVNRKGLGPGVQHLRDGQGGRQQGNSEELWVGQVMAHPLLPCASLFLTEPFRQVLSSAG